MLDNGLKLSMLQWGHGPEAVETTCPRSKYGRSFPLQWGHGPEAVETDAVAAGMGPVCALQWGHGPEAVETELAARRLVGAARASMGPRP